MPKLSKRHPLPPVRRLIDLNDDDPWNLTPRWSRDLEEVQPPRRRAVSRSKPPAAPVKPAPPRRPMRAALVRVLRRLLELIEGRS